MKFGCSGVLDVFFLRNEPENLADFDEVGTNFVIKSLFLHAGLQVAWMKRRLNEENPPYQTLSFAAADNVSIVQFAINLKTQLVLAKLTKIVKLWLISINIKGPTLPQENTGITRTMFYYPVNLGFGPILSPGLSRDKLDNRASSVKMGTTFVIS